MITRQCQMVICHPSTAWTFDRKTLIAAECVTWISKHLEAQAKLTTIVYREYSKVAE